MSDYTWPAAWKPSRWEMRLIPNTRVFTGPYTPTTQVIDLMGERWSFSFDLTPVTTPREAAAFEAFFDRLKGKANRIVLWNLSQPAPLGSLRDTDIQTVTIQNSSLATVTIQNSSLVTVPVQSGDPQISAPITQGDNTALITGIAGRTLYAGDTVGLSTFQTVRILADVTLDENGQATIEFAPRARQDIPANTPLITDKPKINVILKADGVPVVRRPGLIEGPSLEAIEAF